ncbi:MAG: LamG-like jellyroll fold domain-containing protein, partial [Cyclobacteriaceae bacterium]
DPTNLFTVEVTPTQIDLSWDDNSSDETDFIIERATDYGFTQNLQTFNFGGANGTATASFSNTTLLAPEIAYFYRVKATNGSGDSGYTNLKAGTTITAPGNALDFDGANDYVDLPDPSVFDFGTGDFTVEAYINGRNVGGGSQVIVGDFGTDVTNALTFWISGNSVRAAVGGPTPHLSTPAILTNNNWYHVAFVREGDQAKIYVDGVEQASTTGLATELIQSPDNMTIGRQIGGSPFYFNGLIDEVRFWNFARSAPQILSDLQIPVSGSEVGLVAYYQFDQGIAGGNNTSPAVDLLPDRSLNHNHGVLNGFGLNGATSNWITSAVPPPPLRILSVLPSENQIGVANNSNISVTFNEDIDGT